MPKNDSVLLLLISCGLQLSKKREAQNRLSWKHDELDNPVNINSPHDRYGIPIHYAVLNNYPL